MIKDDHEYIGTIGLALFIFYHIGGFWSTSCWLDRWLYRVIDWIIGLGRNGFEASPVLNDVLSDERRWLSPSRTVWDVADCEVFPVD